MMYDTKDLEIARLKGQIELLKEQLTSKQVEYTVAPFIVPLPIQQLQPVVSPWQPDYFKSPNWDLSYPYTICTNGVS